MPTSSPYLRTLVGSAAAAIFVCAGIASAGAQTNSLACQPGQECYRDPNAPVTRGFRPAATPTVEMGSEVSRRYTEKGAKEGKFPSYSKEIYFEYNSAEITTEARAVLDEFGRMLKDLPDDQRRSNSFRVIGYTDAKGNPDYNQRLSDRRAHAAAEYLANNKYIELYRLDPYGRGKTELRDPQHPFAPTNRRVQLINIGSNVAVNDTDKSPKRTDPRPSPTPSPSPKECTRFEPSIGQNISVPCDR